MLKTYSKRAFELILFLVFCDTPAMPPTTALHAGYAGFYQRTF